MSRLIKTHTCFCHQLLCQLCCMSVFWVHLGFTPQGLLCLGRCHNIAHPLMLPLWCYLKQGKAAARHSLHCCVACWECFCR